jgi:hypothetical protein
MRRLFVLVFVGSLLAPVGTSAQSFAVAVQAGSMGLGGSAIYGVTPKLNVRGSFGFIPVEPDFTVDEVDFTSDLPAFLRATVDFYPVGFFYLSGGGLFLTKGGDIAVNGQFTGTQDFGGTSYTAAEVGDLIGVFSLSSAMPYLGIGFGNPIGRRIGFALDLGVGIGSVPAVELGATGPISTNPTFVADLNQREEEFQADIPEVLRYYPVISLALSFGIGG